MLTPHRQLYVSLPCACVRPSCCALLGDGLSIEALLPVCLLPADASAVPFSAASLLFSSLSFLYHLSVVSLLPLWCAEMQLISVSQVPGEATVMLWECHRRRLKDCTQLVDAEAVIDMISRVCRILQVQEQADESFDSLEVLFRGIDLWCHVLREALETVLVAEVCSSLS